MREQYRTEAKYLLRWTDYYVLREILKHVLRRDSNASENGDYTIRSIYFDSYDNYSFTQKMDGVLERRKIRIRTYGSKVSDYVKLEIKNKWNAGVYKETVNIRKEHAQELLKGNAEVLLEYKNEMANKMYLMFQRSALLPVTAIDYEREAYILPFDQIRITFDKNLRCSADHLRQLEADRVFYPVLDRKYMILEVKYNHFLPDFIKRILGTVPGECLSVSKYCLSQQLLV